MKNGPLSHLRVLDLGHVVAGPFVGTLFGDFGADVIKIEDPRSSGDTMRSLSPKYKGSPIWWKVAGRNKRSVSLDLRSPAGRELLIRLAEQSDVLVENFRPGTLERWDLDPDFLHSVNPGLVVVRISGSGRGPLGRKRPGFGRVGEAMSGIANLTGEGDDRPLHVGFSLGDATTGLMAAFGAMVAIQEREASGKGQVVDLALFEPLFRMIEWQVPFAELLGTVVRRSGNRFPIGYAVGGAFLTKDDYWVTISAATERTISALLRIVGGEEMERDERFSSFERRNVGDHMDLIERAIAEWIGSRPADEVIARFEEANVAASLVYDAAMMLDDEIFREREAIAVVDDPDIGPMRMPSVVPKLLRTPGSIRWAGVRQGAHTEEVLKELLGLSDNELASLSAEGVIGR